MQKASPSGKQIRLLIVRLNCPVLFTLLQSCRTCITQPRVCNGVNVKMCLLWKVVKVDMDTKACCTSCCMCVSSFNNFDIWRLQELASMVLVPYLLGSMGWCKHYFHLSFYRSIKSQRHRHPLLHCNFLLSVVVAGLRSCGCGLIFLLNCSLDFETILFL